MAYKKFSTQTSWKVFILLISYHTILAYENIEQKFHFIGEKLI